MRNSKKTIDNEFREIFIFFKKQNIIQSIKDVEGISLKLSKAIKLLEYNITVPNMINVLKKLNVIFFNFFLYFNILCL